MIMNIFLLAALGYILYRFFTGFLIPVFRASRRMRQQFQDMNQQQGAGPGTSGNGARSSKPPGKRKPNTAKIGEYIDFEEVK
jgi:hypothetical protein